MEGNKRLRRNERCAREKDKYVQNENASPRNEGAQRSLDSCSFLFVRSVLSSIFFVLFSFSVHKRSSVITSPDLHRTLFCRNIQLCDNLKGKSAPRCCSRYRSPPFRVLVLLSSFSSRERYPGVALSCASVSGDWRWYRLGCLECHCRDDDSTG